MRCVCTGNEDGRTKDQHHGLRAFVRKNEQATTETGSKNNATAAAKTMAGLAAQGQPGAGVQHVQLCPCHFPHMHHIESADKT